MASLGSKVRIEIKFVQNRASTVHAKLTPDLEHLLFQVVERVGLSSWEGVGTKGDENTVEKREMERIVLKPLYQPPTSDLSLDQPQLETFLFFKIPFAPSFVCPPHTPFSLPQIFQHSPLAF